MEDSHIFFGSPSPHLTPLILPVTNRKKKVFKLSMRAAFFRSARQNFQFRLQEITMRIPKLFKKAAALVMAAVTALSLIPATTSFAAGDIGTISFSHIYDSGGNAMRYNSSATINGYTAGGTGNYKYRMSVDGETAFCIQPGVPLKTGNTLKKASSDTWNALSANQKKAVGLALLYGYQGNRSNLTGSDDEKWLATQTLVWEFVTGCREATGSYRQTSTTVYSLHFGSNYANSGARAAYDQIVSLMSEHNTIPSFLSGGKNDITKELAYKDGKYSITLTDKNGVLSDYSFTSSDANVSVSKDGNKLTVSSKKAISGSVRITATRNGVPTVSDSARLIAYGDPNLQDLVTGVENTESVKAYINVETPTGTIALKKTSEDGVVAGISFHIKGDGFDKTVKTLWPTGCCALRGRNIFMKQSRQSFPVAVTPLPLPASRS